MTNITTIQVNSYENYVPPKKSKFLDDGKTLAICRRYNTPGPSVYTLPPTIGYIKHDLTIPKNPAYSISQKLPTLVHKNSSPGPIYFPTFNPSTCTGFAITGKRREIIKDNTPGPGAYHPSFPKANGSSCYIGRRRKSLESTNPIAPNHYNIGGTFGSKAFLSQLKNSPGFKFNKRGDILHIINTTASIKSEYNPSYDFVKPHVPKWSMTGRHYLPEMTKNTPGPNVYKPEEVTIPFRRAPKVSMGVRYSEFCSIGHMSQENDAF